MSSHNHSSAKTLVYDISNKRYINLTNACTLQCTFCPKFNGNFQVKGHQLDLNFNPKAQQIISQLGDVTTVEEVIFCGFGESTLRLKELIKVAQWIKQQGGRVRLNTDGLGNLVNKQNILEKLSLCVDALSISLNAHNEAIYQQHCQPTLSDSYQHLLAFIKLAPQYISDVTVTAIDGLENVDIRACEQIAKHNKVKFRRRVLDNVG